jgi:hypothetical protein
MTHNENQQIGEIFAQVKRAGIEAPPFMKTRVLVQLRQERDFKQKLMFWRAISVGALATLIATFFIGFKVVNDIKADAVIRQAYVIHVDFTQDDQVHVAKAEVELPRDVHFVSKHDLGGVRKIRLPVDIKVAGRGKLPFVVSADTPGEKRIVIRLLDREDQVIREQVLKYNFASVL